MSVQTEASDDRSNSQSHSHSHSRPSQFASSSEGEASGSQCASQLNASYRENHFEKACTTCGATDTPMWRNGACGPKTLCNACGVKYQRHVHKEKVAAEAQRDAELIAASTPEDAPLRGSDGGRSQRSCASGSRNASLARPAATRSDVSSGDTDVGSGTPPRSRPKRNSRSKASAKMGAHSRTSSARSLNEASGSGRLSNKTGSGQARSASAGAVRTTHRAVAAMAQAAADVPSGQPAPVRRLDGLQMQRQQNGVVLALSNITVLLQPVTQAQRLWGAAPDAGPAVAICAYDSGGSFLAAAPRTAGGTDRGCWAFPTTTSAAWISGHDWTLFFTEQRQYEDFNKLLAEWKSVADRLGSACAPSQEDGGAAAWPAQAQLSSRQSTARQRQPSAGIYKKGRKRTVNCIRAVDADEPCIRVPDPASMRGSIGVRQTKRNSTSPAPAAGMQVRKQGMATQEATPSLSSCSSHFEVAQSPDKLPVVLEGQPASLAEPGPVVAGDQPQDDPFNKLGKGSSLPAGMSQTGLRSDAMFFGGASDGQMPVSISLDCSDMVGGRVHLHGTAMQHKTSRVRTASPQLPCATHEVGSLGSASSMSVAPPYHSLNNHFSTLHVASNPNLASMAQCQMPTVCGSLGTSADVSHVNTPWWPCSEATGKQHGMPAVAVPAAPHGSHSRTCSGSPSHFTMQSQSYQGSYQGGTVSELPMVPTEQQKDFGFIPEGQAGSWYLPDGMSSESADTEARVRDGQPFSGASFASMPLAGTALDFPLPLMKAPSDMDMMLLDDAADSPKLLDDIDLDLDPLDPQFLEQVVDPAVRGGSAAQQLLHPARLSQPTSSGPVGTTPQHATVATDSVGISTSQQHASHEAGNAFLPESFLCEDEPFGCHVDQSHFDKAACDTNQNVALPHMNEGDQLQQAHHTSPPPTAVNWLDLAWRETAEPPSSSGIFPLHHCDPIETAPSEPRQPFLQEPLPAMHQHSKGLPDSNPAGIPTQSVSQPVHAIGKQMPQRYSVPSESWDHSVQRAASSMEECYLPWTPDI